MAVIDIKNATIKLRDGTEPVANTLEIKVGEGNLTYTETKNREYILDRGLIDSVRDGDEEPMELSFDLLWEEVIASNGGTLKPEEALKKIAGAAAWTSSDPDACQPYAVDVELELDANCLDVQEREILTFPDYRYESLPHDVRAGTISSSGSCNATVAIIEHAVAAKVAAAFDGANTEWLEATDNAIFPVGAAASFDFWFRAEGVAGNQALMTKWDDGTEEWAIHLVADKLRIDIAAAAPAGLGVNYEQSTTDFLADTWYHIVITYAAGVVLIYVNGVLDAGSTTTGTIPVVITDTVTVVQLGAGVDMDGAGDRYEFTGRLAEAFMYGTTILQASVTAIYNNGLGLLYANRAAAEAATIGWDLGELSGTRVAAVGAVNLTDNATVLYDNGIRVRLQG